MSVNDALADRQAQTQPLRLGGLEGFPEILHNFLRHTRPSICQGGLDITIKFPAAYGERAALRHSVDRVLNKPPKLRELRAALAELAGSAVSVGTKDPE